ncbi:TLDc domain [Trypanosoma melophagium]|uniref:TLDc domain n=1 Tax=Trypanosoma melophagium TaxID=715481 RepID=UPI003519FC5C|nr:TLDc domain [Trypanosoma melophagium]
MCAQSSSFTCRITPPGTAVRVRKQYTATSTLCTCCLDTDALFPYGPPSPPLPLSRCEIHELLLALPRRLQYSPWQVCYDTEHDGFSLQNFYRVMQKVHADGASGIGVFLVMNAVSDSKPSSPLQFGNGANVIGCFTPEVPCLEHSQHAFFGSEETFVFSYADVVPSNNNNNTSKMNNTSNNDISSNSNFGIGISGRYGGGGSVRKSSRSTNGRGSLFYTPPRSPVGRVPTLIPRILSIYPWAMDDDNREFLFCANDFFGIGGGRDGAAILVDSNLLHGSSSVHCGTFASPPLCGEPHPTLRHSEFTILRMVWFKVKERKGSFTCMDMCKREACDCGRLMESVVGGFGMRLQNCTQKKGWHLCSEDQNTLFTAA